MKDILLISRAWHFAAQRHSTQRRKGEAQEPYVNHLAEVAELVATATEGQDANLVAAAVLHDTVEDGTALINSASLKTVPQRLFRHLFTESPSILASFPSDHSVCAKACFELARA
jgi:HD domain